MLCLVPMVACDDGEHTVTLRDSGAIEVALHVSPSSGTVARSRHDQSADSSECQYAGIVTFIAELHDQTNTLVSEAGPWACAAGPQVIEDIPAGSGYRLVILCLDSDGNTKYRGEAAGITVRPNETTSLTTINTYLFYPALLCPEDGAVISDTGFYLKWDYVLKATSYRLIVSENEDLSQPVIDESIRQDTLFYPVSDLEVDVTYYWQVSAMDSNDNRSTGSDTWHFNIDPDGYPYDFWCENEEIVID